MNDSAYWDLHAKGVRALNDLRFVDAEDAFTEARRKALERGLSGLADRAFCHSVSIRLERDQRADVQTARLSEILGCSEDRKARQLGAYCLASFYRLRGNTRPAQLYAAMAARLAEEARDLLGQASSFDLLGLLALGDSRLENARENLLKSLEASRRMNFPSVVLITVSTLGYCLSLMGRWNESRGYLEESQQILEDAGVRLYVPDARLNLGFAFLEHGDVGQAIEHGQAVLAHQEGRGDLAKHAHYLLGEAYAQQADDELAAEHFEILQKTWYPQRPDLLEILLSFRTSGLLNWLGR
jgi:tetratricopeptide (TPR) repeat protein